MFLNSAAGDEPLRRFRQYWGRAEASGHCQCCKTLAVSELRELQKTSILLSIKKLCVNL